MLVFNFVKKPKKVWKKKKCGNRGCDVTFRGKAKFCSDACRQQNFVRKYKSKTGKNYRRER